MMSLSSPRPLQITLNAFTSKAGAAFNTQSDGSARVSSQRCAFLMTCAIYHRLHEVWIALQPILVFTYLAQYAPSLFSHLSVRMGPARVKAYRDGVIGHKYSLFGKKEQ
jgi:dehydrogenase/reductase SDR family protein 7